MRACRPWAYDMYGDVLRLRPLGLRPLPRLRRATQSAVPGSPFSAPSDTSRRPMNSGMANPDARAS